MPTPTGSAAVAKFPRSPAAQSPCPERAESGYTGDRAAHKKHGTGVQAWADGCRYEGEFVDDLKHDFGVFTWANGEVLVCLFVLIILYYRCSTVFSIINI